MSIKVFDCFTVGIIYIMGNYLLRFSNKIVLFSIIFVGNRNAQSYTFMSARAKNLIYMKADSH